MQKLYNFYFYLLMPVFLLNQFVFKLVSLPSWLTGLVLVLGAILFFAHGMKMRKKVVK